ncbi:MAG: VCBS repeat-containing protein, partial [Bacteroidetes bacterium]|nr:VCBS repeat-containing protein [Bacteroidota bacterium]
MKHESLTHSKYRLNGYERLFAVVLLVCILGCNSGDSRMDTQDQSAGLDEPVLFTELSVEQTGIDFINNIFEDGKINGLNYDYLYNGGGVAVGDINNDGKVDIYFTGNMVSNKLYINLGDFKFEDITRKAGVEAKDSWCGGVSMVDINDDGYLDIYVCRSFNKDKPELRKNLLYINNGDLTFTERAAEYGLNDRAYSVQAAWFDYDRDGDLDMYLANHLIKIRLTTALRRKESQSPDEDVRDKLYQNQGNGKFIEVSKSSGIYNYGCGLGVAVGDLNNDGWPDVYVANDYMEPDFYYVNNGDGTFTDVGVAAGATDGTSISYGVTAGDYDSDGDVDLYVANSSTANQLYRNEGNSNKWLTLTLKGSNHSDGIGAR